jgi:hypothetical protein
MHLPRWQPQPCRLKKHGTTHAIHSAAYFVTRDLIMVAAAHLSAQ